MNKRLFITKAFVERSIVDLALSIDRWLNDSVKNGEEFIITYSQNESAYDAIIVVRL